MFFRMLEDTWMTSIVERTRNAPWGLVGGFPGRPNSAVLRRVDGTRLPITKETRVRLEVGDVVELYCGGGGGFGEPSARDEAAVHYDIEEGYVTEAEARSRYPHAFEGR
jgi:N-methylhydantoinase B